jgi:FkbM family methyltransferase
VSEEADLGKVDVIAGGFWVPKGGTHIPFWQNQLQRLDHDLFLPPYCAQFIPTGGCAVDAGALNGDHTIVYSRKAGQGGLIFAFEPGLPAFECLEHNITLFEHQNVVIAPFALGEAAGTCGYKSIPGVDLGSAYCDGEGDIKVVTLDSMVKPGFTPRKVDFMKLDIEGYEYKALQGATRILQEDRPIMVMEINKYAEKRGGCSYEQVKSLISQFGYLSRQVDGQQKDEMLWDEVCWPEEMGPNPPPAL